MQAPSLQKFLLLYEQLVLVCVVVSDVTCSVRAGRCLLIENTREETSWERETGRIRASPPIHRKGHNGIWYERSLSRSAMKDVSLGETKYYAYEALFA